MTVGCFLKHHPDFSRRMRVENDELIPLHQVRLSLRCDRQDQSDACAKGRSQCDDIDDHGVVVGCSDHGDRDDHRARAEQGYRIADPAESPDESGAACQGAVEKLMECIYHNPVGDESGYYTSAEGSKNAVHFLLLSSGVTSKIERSVSGLE